MFVNCLFWGISHSYNCTNITTQASIFDCTTGQTARLAEKCCARARPSIAGPGYRGRWVRPSVAGAGCSRPSRTRAAPLRARIENACTTSSNMACAIVGACLRLVDFMQRLQLPRQVRFWFCLLRSSTHEENTLQGAGCVDRGRTLQLSRAVLCPGAAVFREPGLRPSRARVAAVHRGRGRLHCKRGLQLSRAVLSPGMLPHVRVAATPAPDGLGDGPDTGRFRLWKRLGA